MSVAAIIPALDEAATVGDVVASLLTGPVTEVIVVDNGSRDDTGEVARRAGARVVREPCRGYGAACLAGIAATAADILVFVDADGSHEPSDVSAVIAPVASGDADLVIGARSRADPGALTWPQRLGNRVATLGLGVIYGAHATDLGPLRAVSAAALRTLGMRDRGFGWTVEMQARAALRGLRVLEVPVAWHPRRGGQSKVSGQLVGSVRAGVGILSTLVRVRFR